MPRHQDPRANSKPPAGKRMPLENILNTAGYHDIRKYFFEILILPYFRKFSHSKITTYTVVQFADDLDAEGHPTCKVAEVSKTTEALDALHLEVFCMEKLVQSFEVDHRPLSPTLFENQEYVGVKACL